MSENLELTRDMALHLKEVARYNKHFCFGCDQRNGIDNVFFCLNCGEIRCWQCIHQHEKKSDPFDGKMHHVCRCGKHLKLWDEWRAQAEKLFPELFT